MASHDQFARTLALLCTLALVIASVASPADPFTLVRYAAPLLVVAVVLSVALTYGGVLESIRNES
ncbi:uncharacterized protein Nmag_1860 [Natrialba magadii ATCC 43099]|uniref:Uncharacterized protein n=1 Tax=Natrialba magadii (strain ATCC 43099 / DSM 3394 / CCM 3739 / CIP 104546 / IAM 13178 / JCM 8861 / NBRC 102185 / NCIMB 2190 / MS3) TaxID=547559 RepID=D3SV25_NATMM|nr:hypothetical protein [Natrialba magadii]ADD05433.1 uncharacterized protein Nmag_1860 [Natrialba magadii ATCC 43099]ELY29253.1 hypothetical protein C500_11065 [Natrialba magadii ATCC 43099]